MPSKVSLLLFATTLAFGASTLVLVQKLRVAEQRNEVLQGRIAEASSPRIEKSARINTPVSDSPVERTQAPQQSGARDEPDSTEPDKQNKESKWAARWLEQLKNPKYRASRIAGIRLDMEERNPGLARVLGLSPEESAAFFELLARQELEDQERSMLAETGTWKEESLEERQQRLREVAEKIEAERLALLGAQRYETWQDYLESAPTRQAVDRLRLKLVDAGLPLRPDQVDPLVADLSAELRRHRAQTEDLRSGRRGKVPPAEYAKFMKELNALTEEHLDKAHDIASLHLTSNQLEVFDEMLDQQRKRSRAGVAESQAYAKAQGGG